MGKAKLYGTFCLLILLNGLIFSEESGDDEISCYTCDDEEHCLARMTGPKVFTVVTCTDTNICWTKVRKEAGSAEGILVERSCEKGLDVAVGCKQESDGIHQICYCQGTKCNEKSHGLAVPLEADGGHRRPAHNRDMGKKRATEASLRAEEGASGLGSLLLPAPPAFLLALFALPLSVYFLHASNPNF